MSIEGQGERPHHRELVPYRSNPPERVEANREHSATTQLAPRGREQHPWEDLPHEQLVQNIRSFITREQLNKRFQGDPEGLIRKELSSLAAFTIDKERDERANEVWRPVLRAWEVVAYEHYGGIMDQNWAVFYVSHYYERAQNPVIRLTETQARILDALTEAVDIPHQLGQTEFEIPEKMRNYDAWIASPERKAWNVNQARAEVKRRYTEWMERARSEQQQRK